jgi:sulfopyruvate decarboxylase subunit alpha
MTTISQQLLAELKGNGADYFASVPCKLLGDLINLLAEDKSITYVPAAREEEGLGLCAGAFLGGKTPVLVMQNTGLGTIITSLFSLGLFYNLPITMIISHRGTPGEPIGTQVPMSNAVKPLLDTVGIPYFAFSDPTEVGKVGRLVSHAQVAQRPVAALLDFDFWGKA